MSIIIKKESNSLSFQQTDHEKFPRQIKEAEDIQHPPFSILKRQASQDRLKLSGPQKTESQEIANRCGEIWKCVGRKPNKFGKGFIYIFRMKEEYDIEKNYAALRQKAELIYPANEIVNPDQLKFLPIHEKVGFNRTGCGKNTLVHLPDREALMTNWQKLRETNSELPPLDILSAEGISGDEEYIEGYLTHDVLLSTGKEFFHDCVLHVAPTIAQMSDLKNGNVNKGTPSFQKEKTRIIKIISKFYKYNLIAKEKIGQIAKSNNEVNIDEDVIKKLNFILGYVVDSFSSARNTKDMDETWVQNAFKMIWDHPPSLMRKFLQRRFGTETLSNIPFVTISNQLKKIATPSN